MDKLKIQRKMNLNAMHYNFTLTSSTCCNRLKRVMFLG